uniref:Ig-like domain-containing protein n=1 Tax=Anas platyrhynchos platyrhynchos TaxID=8840 RepID=A0A493TKF6_ANAPP
HSTALLKVRSVQGVSVTQQEGQVSVEQGNTFQTHCTYQSSTLDAWFWYQQKKGQAPQLISYQAGAGTKQSDRFTTELNTERKSSVLRLKEVKLSDSTLYFCAVSDTLVQEGALALGSGGRKMSRCTERWSPSLDGQWRVACDVSKQK